MAESEPYQPPGTPTARELELLQTIAVLAMERGEPPHLSAVAEVFGVTRQATFYWVRRMRKKGLLEDGPGNGPKVGLQLSHNGKLAVATSAP